MRHLEIIETWRMEAKASRQDLKAYIAQQLESDASCLPRLAACMGLVVVDSAALASASLRFDRLPIHDALVWRSLPVEIDGQLLVVVADPFSREVREALFARFAGEPLAFALGVPGEVDALLEKVAASERVMDGVEGDASDAGAGQGVQSISLTSIAKDDNPVVRLVNSTLYDALQSRASDIHIESTPEGLSIRYRIDGVLQAIRQIAGVDLASQALSRLKVLALLDIAERRVPQDGRFKIESQGREIDFRVSIMPGTHGENAVLRVLDRSQRSGSLNLDILGLDPITAARIRALSQRPYGLTLVSGPTGSGKSTTLYAALSEFNTGEEKIITIEDPVEYELTGVLQIPVNERKGLTFARGLRSILRHDPDTIMIGEIRDADTASIAVQSALTGHRVLSTVHANDAFSVIDRFIYMGVEPSTFLEALNGVISQRLVRRICPHCAPPESGHEDRYADMPLEQLKRAVTPGSGCDTCRGTGYYGRICLAEVMLLGADMKAALSDRSVETRMRVLKADSEYRSIGDAGIYAVRRRRTTFQEVQRAIAME
ncbi:GspE/PulE family protein [Achromobacter xylosoxidans]|uniref:GspE/PulE family protein n=1 Tax=Alcaligenes xylosoxydans xylosoxydans TaxID=85698 RepID=UPI00192C9CB5|nr:GspE/PulE family protein [Achromobacter xylosoxidans]